MHIQGSRSFQNAGPQAPETVKVFALEQKQKHSPRRHEVFNYIEFKQLFFLRDLRVFVVNRLLNRF